MTTANLENDLKPLKKKLEKEIIRDKALVVKTKKIIKVETAERK